MKRAYFVRKRWDGRGVYLIHLTTVVEMGACAEAVWDRLDGQTSIEEIAADVAEQFSTVDKDALEALVAYNVMLFAEHGLLQNVGSAE